MPTAGDVIQASDIGSWTSYTPSWTASTTNPAIGNGTITGRYQVIGGTTCHFYVKITMGTTTTYGTGYWIVSLPVTAAVVDQIVQAHVRDASAGNEKPASARIGTSAIVRIHLGDGAWVDSTTYVWASGDLLVVSGTYETA